MTIFDEYEARCQKPREFADIWEHLPTLRAYASLCSSVTEFGTRTGNSAIAFMSGLARNGGSLTCYDIDTSKFTPPEVDGVTVSFVQQNTAAPDFEIESTDLLFIDSCHDFPHVAAELRHEKNVRKFILMHDTDIMWLGGVGPLRALVNFLPDSAWKIREHFANCNGLTILERRYPL